MKAKNLLPPEQSSPDVMGFIRAFGNVFISILSCMLMGFTVKLFINSGWIILVIMIVLVFLSSFLIGGIGFWLSRLGTRED